MGFALWFAASRGDDSNTGSRDRRAKLRLESSTADSSAQGSSAQGSSELDALSTRIRQGDTDAFTAFVHMYYEAATNVAYGVVRSIDAARDIAQDVFVRFWERRETLDAMRLTKAYVLSAAHYRALNMVRGEQVRARYRERWRDDEAATASSSEEAVLSEATLDDALRTLPERWRFILQLRFEEQIPLTEIATALGLTPNATRQLLHRAIRELRRRFTRE